MSAIRSLLKPIFPVLPPLERLLLDYVAEHAPDDGVKAALNRTALTINHAFHYPGWRETQLSRLFFGKSFRARGTKIETPLDSWLLCTVTFSVPEKPGPVRAKYWLYAGRLFEVKYSADIKKFRKSVPTITKVQYNIPRPIDAFPPGEPISKEELMGLLGPWAAETEFLAIKPPDPAELRTEVLKQLEMRLPQDYLDLTAKCGGFSTRYGELLGVLNIRVVSAMKGTYAVLADLSDAHYIVYTRKQQLLLIDHEETRIKKLENGVIDALRQTMTSDTWIV